jgi:hypothetical protein
MLTIFTKEENTPQQTDTLHEQTFSALSVSMCTDPKVKKLFWKEIFWKEIISVLY